MKPISIRFKCFGPYMDEQFIDFQQLERNGLFLICGETGAGKTTILDAMCYALYGRSSGGLRGDLDVMRCKLAGKDDETLVEYIFDSNGKRYKFVRSLRYGSKRLNDYHNCMVWDGDVFVPIFENPKLRNVNQKAEELLGLTYDQFRQVIILPQGQFEKLLVSNSQDKESILVSLFHADRWQRITGELYNRVAARDSQLKQELAQIQAKLNEYDCPDLDGLSAALDTNREALSTLSAHKKQAEQTATEQRKRYEAALLANEAFAELDKRQKKYKDLLKLHPEKEQESALLELAAKADTILPAYNNYQESRKRHASVKTQLVQARKRKEASAQALVSVKSDQAAHEVARPKHEARQKEIARLETARELYESLARQERAAADAKNKTARANAALLAAKEHYSAMDQQWLAAMDAQRTAMDRYTTAQATYLASIGGILAQKLESGLPCPVCGSTQHPAPAALSDAHISDRDLDNCNLAVTQASEAVTYASEQRTKAANQENEAQAAFDRLSQELATANAHLEALQRLMIPDIQNTQQLEARISTLQGASEHYLQEESELTARLSAALGDDRASDAAVAQAVQTQQLAAAELAELETAWQTALADSGLETEQQFLAAKMDRKDRDVRWQALSRYYADLNSTKEALQEQQESLHGQSAPAIEEAKRQRDAADQALQTVTKQFTLEQQKLDTMEKDFASLTRRKASHDSARITTDADLEFANRLQGRSGISLQRYVLGVMLTSITVEANRLLKSVHGGRYQLFRTNEIAGSSHKGGLELEVYDSQNNERRSVTTLSGGEKFLVALSLAIGLSTVVQAQSSGIRLEAMFIDEGFGSLDHESIDDALEVLQGVQRSHGLVGIISHVDRLEETIQSKIQVVKGRNSSRCIVS